MNIGFWMVCVMASMFSKSQPLKEGSRLPEFPLVIYFYPKDDTPGCTKEACSFRDSYESFQDMGARVIGISADDVASHKAFAVKYRLPFDLLSDPGNAVRKQFGVPADLFGLIPGRVTYVFDRQGVCVKVFNAQLQAEQHMTEALKALQ
jgi:peroxiredoxin Q/BCP